MPPKTALIAGSTGIVGLNLASHLIQNNWTVYGLARKPSSALGIHPIPADLLNPITLGAAVRDLRPTHIFITSWLRQPTEAENINVNSAMVRNLLDALSRSKTIEHVALVTGLKHYLGPFESYGKGALPPTPFREDQPRLNVENFYYVQEDEVLSAAQRDNFHWTVHRPHTIIGYAIGNAMNMGVTLAVYATICKETGRPFLFPGSPAQWNGLTDMTDARLLARHLEWAATFPPAHNNAFNIVNGDVFRWSWMWQRLAHWFGLEPAPYPGVPTPLDAQLAHAVPIWAEIASKYRLGEPDVHILTSPWHTDADLGRPIEVITDMSKSRRRGFLDYQPTDDSFFDLFARLREVKLIP